MQTDMVIEIEKEGREERQAGRQTGQERDT